MLDEPINRHGRHVDGPDRVFQTDFPGPPQAAACAYSRRSERGGEVGLYDPVCRAIRATKEPFSAVPGEELRLQVS